MINVTNISILSNTTLSTGLLGLTLSISVQWRNCGEGRRVQVVRAHRPEKIAALFCPFPKMSFSVETLL